MSIGTRPEPHPKRIVTHAPVERRLFVGDRRDTWRGSRRDVDWLKHFEQETVGRRGSSLGATEMKSRASVS